MAVRAIHFASTVIVAGAVLFAYCVAEPAFRTVADPLSPVVRPFRASLSVILLASLALAVISGACKLLITRPRRSGAL